MVNKGIYGNKRKKNAFMGLQRESNLNLGLKWEGWVRREKVSGSFSLTCVFWLLIFCLSNGNIDSSLGTKTTAGRSSWNAALVIFCQKDSRQGIRDGRATRDRNPEHIMLLVCKPRASVWKENTRTSFLLPTRNPMPFVTPSTLQIAQQKVFSSLSSLPPCSLAPGSEQGTKHRSQGLIFSDADPLTTGSPECLLLLL